MKVENITFKQYTELKDRSEHDSYLRYGKFEGKDCLQLGDFLNLPFWFVKDMQYHCNHSAAGLNFKIFFELIAELKNISVKEIALNRLYDLHCARLYCIDEVQKINEMENNFLGHTPTVKEKNAGIDNFASYGSFIQFDSLAHGDLLRFESIKKLPYDLCFTKMKLEADRNAYEKAYSDQMKQNN